MRILVPKVALFSNILAIKHESDGFIWVSTFSIYKMTLDNSADYYYHNISIRR